MQRRPADKDRCAMFFPRIEELATTDIVSVGEHAPLSAALQHMSRGGVR